MPRWVQALHAAVGAAVLSVGAVGASAATIEFSESVFGEPGTTFHIDLPQFDPTGLPALVSVTIRIGSQVDLIPMRGENATGSLAVGRALVERTITFSGPDVSGAFDYDPRLASVVGVPAGGVFDYQDQYLGQLFPAVGAGSLTPYVGTGTVGFDVTVSDALSVASSNPAIVFSLRDEGRARATVRVIYTYVPEPATAMLVAVGLLALAARRR